MPNDTEVQIIQIGPLYFFTCVYPGNIDDLSRHSYPPGKPWDTFVNCYDSGCFAVQFKEYDIFDELRGIHSYESELQHIWTKLYEHDLVTSAEMPPILQGSPVALAVMAK